MSRTIKRIFRRLHEAGILLGEKPEDYTFHRHYPSQSEREAGAMLWSIIRRDCGLAVTSMFSVADCTKEPVELCRSPWGASNEKEIIPKSVRAARQEGESDDQS